MNNKRGSGIVTLVIVLAVICIVFLVAGFSIMAIWSGGWNFFREFPESVRNVEEFSIDQTREHDIAGVDKFEFMSLSADMDIVFADTDKVRVDLEGSYRSSRGIVELKMDKEGDSVKFYVDYPKISGLFNWNGTNLTITVPKDLENRIVKFITVSGDVDIPSGFKTKEIWVNSTSGDIQISDVECEGFYYGNVSGRLDISGIISDEIKCETVSGDVDINIYTELDLIDVDSVSGDVDIYVDKNLGFRFDYNTVSGRFNCEFPVYESGGRNDRSGYTDETATMDFDIGTVSGDFRIRN